MTAYMSSNYYYNDGDKYIGTGNATLYTQISGQHIFYTAPSGTAGNAISFTQAMTLDASGNLLVGGTAQSGTANRAAVFSANKFGLSIIDTTAQATGVGGALNLGGNYRSAGDAQAFCRVAAAKENSTDTNFAYAMTFATTPNGGTFTEGARISSDGTFRVKGAGTAGSTDAFQVSGSAPADAARITSGGNLLVGTTSQYGSQKLSVNGGIAIDGRSAVTPGLSEKSDDDTGVFWPTANTLGFSTGGTERARITSGGYFKASNNGTYASSSGALHELKGDPDDNVVRIENYQASLTGAIAGVRIIYSAATPNTTTSSFLYCNDSTALRAEIRSNGGLANYSGNDVNLSDRREKTNFAPAKSYLDTICAIPVQTFNYIDQSEDDPGLTLGVVAQDVQAVAPELVMESNWGTAEEPKMRLSIYQTDLQYALMKCVQELKAELDSVKAELATLKGQP
jgi:hypothetical protein